MEKRKQHVVITGGGGLLGSTVKLALEKKFDASLFDGDITRPEDFAKYEGGPIDWIVHTAAMTDVNQCEREQELCRNVNVNGTLNTVEFAKKHNAKIIYISTVSVFSGETGNYKENDKPSPVNGYNISKYDGEKIVLKYDKGLVLRINIIGIHPAGSRGQNFFEWLVDSIQANKDMKLFSDVMVNPLSNWTIAECIKNIIEKNPTETVLHIASSNVLSKAEIGKYVMEKLGYRGKAEFASVDSLGGAARPKQMWLNTEHTCKVMNWHMPTLESEIDTILQKVT